jgi:hypothetical protein
MNTLAINGPRGEPIAAPIQFDFPPLEMANVFMCSLEEKLIWKCNELPTFYNQFVDDT